MENQDNGIKSSEEVKINELEKKEELNPNTVLNDNINENNNIMNKSIDESKLEKNNSLLNQNINSISNHEKDKRQRRGKNEISERIYKCPDCEKSYLSGPALMIHRKLKHNYNKSNENKARGRPKKDYQQENSITIAQNKYNSFLNENMRKPLLTDENSNNKITINLEQIKSNLKNIFTKYKADIFPDIDNVENYSFYKILIENWNKENIELNMESYKDNYLNSKEDKNSNFSKNNSPSIDYIFILYLKELSTKTNNEYFLFIIKFIIFFREWINCKKSDIIKEEYKTENKKEFSQLFNAEGIPDYCNDFFLDYLEINKFFGLNEDEFIELTQHFCFWIYLKKYTPNYILPFKMKE